MEKFETFFFCGVLFFDLGEVLDFVGFCMLWFLVEI